MIDGFVIISILALMFLFFYWYSYSTVASEDKKRAEIWKKRHQLEEAFNKRMKERAEMRRQKFEKFMNRSKEIQQELMRLQKSKRIQHN
ncbi:hypothetical protein [Xanthomarina spongicola]|uniref:Uncharacterized protein n=1 Tax=Xanthomarina spongicola TaxID=570520 RepID=A0A316DKM1_9FLAO|nr:hypothetical protein [Xanthomarina spongicola]PWK18236.1 hypothetical protein LX78_02146 [Xanthomarina spongicola]